MKNVINTTWANMKLLWKTPKNYLYSFIYPKDEAVNIQPYNEKVTIIAATVANAIQRTLPGLVLYFFGSASLGIIGQDDIDLVAAGLSQDFDSYLPALIGLFGEPAKIRSKTIEWKFVQDGHRVEFSLMDKDSILFKEQMQAFTVLKANEDLRREYEALKLASRGLSVRAYQRRKMAFFNRIIGL
jgi:GrpB-like predicted nucleotidyltransferase (UPF0157 family)